jgi:hypothetical protein
MNSHSKLKRHIQIQSYNSSLTNWNIFWYKWPMQGFIGFLTEKQYENDLKLPYWLYKNCKPTNVAARNKRGRSSVLSVIMIVLYVLTLLPKYYISSLINHNVIRIVTKYFFFYFTIFYVSINTPFLVVDCVKPTIVSHIRKVG